MTVSGHPKLDEKFMVLLKPLVVMDGSSWTTRNDMMWWMVCGKLKPIEKYKLIYDESNKVIWNSMLNAAMHPNKGQAIWRQKLKIRIWLKWKPRKKKWSSKKLLDNGRQIS